MTRRRVAGALVLLVLLVGLVGLAAARPGGGQSYSGGGGHGGSGGGGGGFLELIYWVIRLIFYYPQIGVPLAGLLVGYFIYNAYRQHQNKDWDSGPPATLERALSLDDIRTVDAEFSQVLFEDFVFRLFSTAHRARHTKQTLATLGPYVSQQARDALEQREPTGAEVQSVVIGSLRTYRVEIPRDHELGRVRVGVEFEANVTTAAHTYYSVEKWLFARDMTRTTKPPGSSKGFPCPNCGAPWLASETGTQVCASCNEAVDNGRFDWVVDAITLCSIDERPPTLTTVVPERGTDLPTYAQPGLSNTLQQLLRTDPAITEASLQARTAMIYDQLNRAWANNDLRPARGLVSDGLYDYLSYWIEAYKRQDLRNELVDMRITRSAFAKVAFDRWYTSVTIRIWGSGKDFVVRASTGEHVRGSKRTDRAYSEYWTLIRSTSRKGPAVAEPCCSNCGAPLQITMAGECEHCSAHVVAGEFDWVLSKIEQDDSYRG